MIDFYHYYDIDLYPADFIEYTSYDHQVYIIILSYPRRNYHKKAVKAFFLLCYFALMKLYYVIFRIFINFTNILQLY